MLVRSVYQAFAFTAILLIYNVSLAQLSPPQLKVWDPGERTGLGMNTVEKLISVPLNPKNPQEGNFDLYYFVKTPENGPALKTILLCAGGPGQLVRTDGDNKPLTDFFPKSGYNVVYFDLRGSGFSQIPSANAFDKFLTTANAVEDVEAIRRDFLGDKYWDAVIGYSYGAVLAHRYTHEYPDKVGKLVLIGPLSLHQFTSSETAYEDYFREVQRIRRQVLETLYTHRAPLNAVSDENRVKIMNDLFGTPTTAGVFKLIEDSFGSEQFVIDTYCDLLRSGALTRYNLGNYGRRFFEMLRKIRYLGWHSDDAKNSLDVARVEMVKVISLGLNPNLKKDLGELELESGCSHTHSQESQRTFYAMGVLDGINRRFLREWIAEGKKNIRRSLLKSAGLAHIEMSVNKSIEKVGIYDDELIKPWDPAIYPHSRPTLILKGGADPVTAWGQAERYYTHGLTGPRTLIEFDGVGHHFHLPTGPSNKDFSDGTILIDPPNIPPGKTTWATGVISNVRRVDSKVNPEQDLTFGELRFETENRVLLQVFNDSENPVTMAAKEFTSEDSNFSGKVTVPATEIPAKAHTWVPGTISVKGSDLKIKPESPGLESGLEYTGKFDTDSWNKLYVEIRNTSAFSIDGQPRNWIYKPIRSPALPCIAGPNVRFNSLDCILYAFVETEHADFKNSLRSIRDRMLNFVKRDPKHCRVENACDSLEN